jgi:hypothetical protein
MLPGCLRPRKQRQYRKPKYYQPDQSHNSCESKEQQRTERPASVAVTDTRRVRFARRVHCCGPDTESDARANEARACDYAGWRCRR